MHELTESQKCVFDFFTAFVQRNQRAPTLGDIKRGLNLSHYSTVRQRLVALERKGHLNRIGGPWSRRPWQISERMPAPSTWTDTGSGNILSLADVSEKKEEPVRLSENWMNKLLGGGIHLGGLVLIAGDPGIGKTTLVLQMAASLALEKKESLILLSEQTIGEVKRRAESVVEKKDLFRSIRVVEGKYIEKLEEIFDQMERPDSPLARIKTIFVDSIQGLGLVSPHRARWEPFFRLLKRAKNRRVCVVLIGHVTKLGGMAGPRALEHEVDIFIHAKKLVDFRVVFVPKNRYGPTTRLLLHMNERGILEPAGKEGGNVPVAIAKGFSWELGFVDVQARVEATPWLGSGRHIPSGGVTRKQLVKVMGILKNLGFDFLSLQTEVQALIPGAQAIAPAELDVPLAVALVGSYLQRAIPNDCAFAGELDLMGSINVGYRQAGVTQMDSLRDQLTQMPIKRLYCHSFNASSLNRGNLDVSVSVVGNLKDILSSLWTDLRF